MQTTCISFFQRFQRVIGPSAVASFGAAILVAGCATPYQTTGLIGAGVIASGASMPSHEIEQIYYLGVFDPQEQLPPTIYRVRMHGQASLISGVKFGSGWVPAQFIDSLSSHVTINPDDNDGVKLTGAKSGEEAHLSIGRRLMMFGPEGFREAPADHRLVIVMGANPSQFFNEMDKALGAISGAEAGPQIQAIRERLLSLHEAVDATKEALSQVERDPVN